ncbi:MAG TPA: Spy/CpxP family protein refolding chaperone [Vicinamibacterales bacterium]|nr:Spy/CpxP family protein refolding chaperone [Vicinamibacterales bacterium]
MAALLLLPGTGRAAALCERAQAAQQRGNPPAEKPKWWIDSQLRAELGITDQQSLAVDQVWQKSLPKLREARQRLEKLEDVLSQMILENAADESAVIAQIEKTESARAEMNGARTLMLYRMNKLLTAEQRAKVKAMHDRRDGGRRSSSSR